jgi:outer membrane lipoprotein-sorting protein
MTALRLILRAALCVAVLIPMTAHAEAPPTDPLDGLRGGAKVRALIDLVVERQRALTSMRSEFVQHKRSALLLEPAESRGEFLFLAPGQVRWNYTEPDGMVVVYANEVLTTYRPDEKSAQAVRVPAKHQRFVRVLAGTQPLDDLESQFAITMTDPGAPAPDHLKLTPTHRTLKARLEVVRLEVDRELLLPIAVEYVEADGDVTRYEFRDLEINVALDEASFALELGDDVRVETIDAVG